MILNNQAQLIEDQKAREEAMHHNFVYYIEKKAVIEASADVLNFRKSNNDEENKSDIKIHQTNEQFDAMEQLLGASNLRVAHMTGTILQNEKSRMQRLIFRATRGTAMVCFRDIQKPIIDYKGSRQFKCVYVIIFQQGDYFEQKLIRIADSFLGNRFQVNQDNYEEELNDAKRNLKDIKGMAKTCYTQIESYLKSVNTLEGSHVSKIQLYKLYLVKEKGIYETINKMKHGHNFFFGAFWIPKSDIRTIEEAIDNLAITKKIRKPHIVKRREKKIVPPTFIRINEFTSAFQEITNTYGVPTYKEVNPSYFGIVTFPFLFGVMFGDICHGTLLFLLASFLCLQPKTVSKTALKPFLPYRYLLLLMGIFAMF